MSYSVGGRGGLDPAMLWLWYRQTAVALIQLPCATGGALKSKKKKERKKRKKKKKGKEEDRYSFINLTI